MANICFVPRTEFQRIHSANMDLIARLQLIADMCRVNTLANVKRAGSGHLGSSFSAMDIVVWLYYAEMNTVELGISHPDRDVYFSSKGHDVPGLYSVLYSLNLIPENRFLRLRRLNGMDGHPDVGVPGIEANSGSLGMGISKARGMAWAKRYLGRGGRVFVLVGDGEFQEGQNFEALQSAVQHNITDLTVIMDHNKVQSDKLVREIVDLQDLNRKLESFGWHVFRCDGHSWGQLSEVFESINSATDRPKFVIADTIKGRGISFMEHPVALETNNDCYPWHAGAPDDQSYSCAVEELTTRINKRLESAALSKLALVEAPTPENIIATSLSWQNAQGEPVSIALRGKLKASVSDEYVADAYGEALVELAAVRPHVVVLDADLAADCRTRAFEKAFPNRFIQNGIAEQDMVSMAGGLALQGLLPVVNSFASFLASRSNEQIYNNNTEGSRVIYVCHYAGLIPAGPGKSHQSIRDVSLLSSLAQCTIIEPCCATETTMAVRYCLDEATDNCVLRLVIGPSPRAIKPPPDYRLTPGRGMILTEGDDAIVFAYGPVMLHEALSCAELLRDEGTHIKVVNMPWLNRVDYTWLRDVIGSCFLICAIEDHAPVGSMSDCLQRTLVSHGLIMNRKFQTFGVDGYPACGTAQEVLRYHGLDSESLAARIRLFLQDL